MTISPHISRAAPLAFLALAPALACGGDMVEVASGFDILTRARPALANDGTVVAARPTELIIADGTSSTVLDLGPSGLSMTEAPGRKPIQVRDAGDLVFLANRATGSGAMCPVARGAYETSVMAGPIATALEVCTDIFPGPAMGSSVAMANNGTVSFSTIRNGAGAIYRHAVGTPPTVLRSGTGEFFNFGGLDVNDAGQVPVQMEYVDGFAGGLMRAVLVFDEVEQAKVDTDTAVEKLGIGQQPPVAINNPGTVAFSINSNMNFPIGDTMYSFVAGVYTATPTLFNTPKMLTPIATFADGYCAFGAVDINDAGKVVFEAQVVGGLNCGGSGYDGLFDGPDPAADAIVEVGDARLGDHQFYDSVFLGEVNLSGQVSFVTTYSEPLVDPVKVWRYDP